ncbi:hypothetical protein HZH68_008402 [Vespula germanica]|uniref:Uncharacterized protein n=1 Tax=Vespula germanica TaxID=30212 RepID=A0A834N7L1_VESGE|nr:hypothetical protein HZH68_008402 [Vespula germanica]
MDASARQLAVTRSPSCMIMIQAQPCAAVDILLQPSSLVPNPVPTWNYLLSTFPDILHSPLVIIGNTVAVRRISMNSFSSLAVRNTETADSRSEGAGEWNVNTEARYTMIYQCQQSSSACWPNAST